MSARDDAEENAVRDLGSRIGFGRVMQLAEQEWAKALAMSGDPPGGEKTTGPCSYFMAPCSHNGVPAHECDWCCGSGRVTKRVAQAMEESISALKSNRDEAEIALIALATAAEAVSEKLYVVQPFLDVYKKHGSVIATARARHPSVCGMCWHRDVTGYNKCHNDESPYKEQVRSEKDPACDGFKHAKVSP